MPRATLLFLAAIVAEIERIAAAHTSAVKPAPTQLEQRISSDQPR